MITYGSNSWTWLLTFIDRDKTGRDLETTGSQIMRSARYQPAWTYSFDKNIFPATIRHAKGSSEAFFVDWGCVGVDESRSFQ